MVGGQGRAWGCWLWSSKEEHQGSCQGLGGCLLRLVHGMYSSVGLRPRPRPWIPFCRRESSEDGFFCSFLFFFFFTGCWNCVGGAREMLTGVEDI